MWSVGLRVGKALIGDCLSAALASQISTHLPKAHARAQFLGWRRPSALQAPVSSFPQSLTMSPSSHRPPHAPQKLEEESLKRQISPALSSSFNTPALPSLPPPCTAEA